jgi:hypothetical protein
MRQPGVAHVLRERHRAKLPPRSKPLRQWQSSPKNFAPGRAPRRRRRPLSRRVRAKQHLAHRARTRRAARRWVHVALRARRIVVIIPGTCATPANDWARTRQRPAATFRPDRSNPPRRRASDASSVDCCPCACGTEVARDYALGHTPSTLLHVSDVAIGAMVSSFAGVRSPLRCSHFAVTRGAPGSASFRFCVGAGVTLPGMDWKLLQFDLRGDFSCRARRQTQLATLALATERSRWAVFLGSARTRNDFRARRPRRRSRSERCAAWIRRGRAHCSSCSAYSSSSPRTTDPRQARPSVESKTP